MEKPLAVDAPGIRQILAANADAKQKNLKVVVGFHNRHNPCIRETIRRLRNVAIGPIGLMRAQGDFLEAIRNPKHEDHESMLEWIGGQFDPEEFDAKEATKALKKRLPDWWSMR